MSSGHLRRVLAGTLLVVVAGTSPLAGAAVETLEMTTPRPFGYVIGDTIEHHISLVLDPGFELDPDSIPEPGRVGRWLALNESALESDERNGTTRHSIRLRYQIVNAATSVIGAGTPPLSLRILGPEGDLPVVIPSWGFTFGPVVTHEDRIAGRPPNLRPALPPPPFETDGRTVRVAALGLLALVLIVLIVRERLAGRLAARPPADTSTAPGAVSGAGRKASNPADAFTRRPWSRCTPRSTPPPGARCSSMTSRASSSSTRASSRYGHPSRRSSRNRESCSTDPTKPLEAPGPSLDRLRDLCRACRDVERKR